MTAVFGKKKHANLKEGVTHSGSKQIMNKANATHRAHTATIEMHSVAQNSTQALLGMGSGVCCLTPNVHWLAKELPAASGSHWLKMPNTEDPVSKITLKG